MIVWGGEGSGGALRSGGVFNYYNQMWSGISLTGAPTARVGHTAVYQELSPQHGRLVVWGGDAGGSTDTGGVYEPPTDFIVAGNTRYIRTIPGAVPPADAVVSVRSLNGFTGSVNLSLSGVSGTFSTNPVTLAANSYGVSTVSVPILNGSPTGDFPFGVVGSWDIQSRTYDMVLRVQDFALTCDPVPVTAPGEDAVTTCRVSSINDFNKEVGLECGNWSCSLDPQLVSPPAGGEVTSELTIHVAPSLPPGSYQVEVVGLSQGALRFFYLDLEVGDGDLIFSDGFESGNTLAWD
jgi:hypothetical protein